LHARPDLKVADIRGNVDTRLRKLDQGQYDAILLAAAGIRRLGMFREAFAMPFDVMLPAVGQGALGLECRDDDPTTQRWLSQLNHEPTWRAVLAERAMLAALQAGCLAPVGAWARQVAEDELYLEAAVLSVDGRRRLASRMAGPADSPETLGRRAAANLFEQGAAELIGA
jgi:hydroxymethylbilane synthase